LALESRKTVSSIEMAKIMAKKNTGAG